jgi:FO synthase
MITYSPEVIIPLTNLGDDHFDDPSVTPAPSDRESPYRSIDEMLELAKAGLEAGCAGACLTLGDRRADDDDEASRWLADRGYRSSVDYLVESARQVFHSTGLLIHVSASTLNRIELEQLRTVAASQGTTIESPWGHPTHGSLPHPGPVAELTSLNSAGELSIPLTAGLLVGRGEDRQDRLCALEAIRASHEEYGHIQGVTVQSWRPNERTAKVSRTADDEEFHWTVAVARLILPESVHIQSPPSPNNSPTELLTLGIDDFAGVSPFTKVHADPDGRSSVLEILAQQVDRAGFVLVPRLTLYPEFAQRSDTFVDKEVRPYVLAQSDSQSLARGDRWFSGSGDSPRRNPQRSTPNRDVQSILRRYEPGYDFSASELVCLFRARGGDVEAVAQAADAVRRERSGDDVTFVVNRNISYTNVCTFRCRFCAFSKGPLSLNLRGAPYLLTLDEISERVRQAEELGATEVCLQGGIHPRFDGQYYVDVIAAVKAGSPNIHIHAFSALEVYEGARRSKIDLETYLLRLKNAGLNSLPGTAAEILDDQVRAVLCPDKINSDQWLQVHRAAHHVGLGSNITIMFGALEGVESWATHLLRTRELQQETGGFSEFVPLPFVHMATPLFLQGRSRRGPTFREALLMHAVGRLHYATLIDNIQVSWVKMGIEGSRRILQAGANDIGGTLMEESIARAAGATHGQSMDESALRELVAPLHRPLRQRSTQYARL